MSVAAGVTTHVAPYTLYLCGPITGLTEEAARGWRRRVIQALSPSVRLIDPTNHSPDPVRRSENAATRALSAERLLHGRRTVARDRFDVQRSDLVLACFLGVRSVSIGSVGEIFWADALRKPVIIVREDDNPHNHDMLNAIAEWIFTDLGAAIDQVKRLVDLSK